MVRLNGPRWELELGGEGYPQSLVELQNPPEVLRGIGDREVLSGPCLAVIGARRATPYGIAAAELAGRVAAECGVTVVSGGAMGCDYAAGMAAAAAGGRTIVVAGTGADVPYPASSTPVFQAAVVCEAAPLPLMLPEPDDPAFGFPQAASSRAAASTQPQRALLFLIDTLPFPMGLEVVYPAGSFLFVSGFYSSGLSSRRTLSSRVPGREVRQSESCTSRHCGRVASTSSRRAMT